MSESDDRAYYQLRAEMELRLSREASDTAAAAAHAELAESYTRLAEGEDDVPMTMRAQN